MVCAVGAHAMVERTKQGSRCSLLRNEDALVAGRGFSPQPDLGCSTGSHSLLVSQTLVEPDTGLAHLPPTPNLLLPNHRPFPPSAANSTPSAPPAAGAAGGGLLPPAAGAWRRVRVKLWFLVESRRKDRLLRRHPVPPRYNPPTSSP